MSLQKRAEISVNISIIIIFFPFSYAFAYGYAFADVADSLAFNILLSFFRPRKLNELGN